MTNQLNKFDDDPKIFFRLTSIKRLDQQKSAEGFQDEDIGASVDITITYKVFVDMGIYDEVEFEELASDDETLVHEFDRRFNEKLKEYHLEYCSIAKMYLQTGVNATGKINSLREYISESDWYEMLESFGDDPDDFVIQVLTGEDMGRNLQDDGWIIKNPQTLAILDTSFTQIQ